MEREESQFRVSDKAFWLAMAGLVVVLFAYQLSSGTSADLKPETVWNEEARQAIPGWLRTWLTIVGVTFMLSVLFVWKRVAARWVLGAFIVSHIPIVFDFGEVSVGMVGWIHLITWSPALIALIRERPQLPLGSFYGLWVNGATIVIFVSLIFDAISAVALVLA